MTQCVTFTGFYRRGIPTAIIATGHRMPCGTGAQVAVKPHRLQLAIHIHAVIAIPGQAGAKTVTCAVDAAITKE